VPKNQSEPDADKEILTIDSSGPSPAISLNIQIQTAMPLKKNARLLSFLNLQGPTLPTCQTGPNGVYPVAESQRPENKRRLVLARSYSDFIDWLRTQDIKKGEQVKFASNVYSIMALHIGDYEIVKLDYWFENSNYDSDFERHFRMRCKAENIPCPLDSAK